MPAHSDHLTAAKLFHVKDYVCVVTGGGTGIGLMAAQCLAANGARVYIVSRRADALERAAQAQTPTNGGRIIPCNPCDVTKKDQIERLVKEISEKESHVNLLVTAAGIAGPKGNPDSQAATELKAKLWDNETVEAWNQTYSSDVTSVYFTTVAFLPLLQRCVEKLGSFASSVITISSMSGMIRHAQGHFAYNSAKGAAVQLTKLMAGEFVKAGVRCNSIAPGYFPSELTAGESGSDQKSELPDSYAADKGHVPIQRPGRDEEMAQAVLFLARNQYVNGEILTVDGGVTNVLAT